jgi:hypothetical protein
MYWLNNASECKVILSGTQSPSCDETEEMNIIKTTCVKIVLAIRRNSLDSCNLFPYILTVGRNSPSQGLVLSPPHVSNIVTNIFLPRSKSVPNNETVAAFIQLVCMNVSVREPRYMVRSRTLNLCKFLQPSEHFS